MLFTNSLGLVSLVVPFLPVLLGVSASPHPLAERVEPSIDLQLYGFNQANPSGSDRIHFDLVRLIPQSGGDGKLYTVEGKWYGERATAEQVRLDRYLAWERSEYATSRLLAWGFDQKLNRNGNFYVIVKDQPVVLNGFYARRFSIRKPQRFSEVNLFPIPEEVGEYTVIGGWGGRSATAKQIFDESQHEDMVQNQPDNLLAYGYDSQARGVFYAIYEDTGNDGTL